MISLAMAHGKMKKKTIGHRKIPQVYNNLYTEVDTLHQNLPEMSPGKVYNIDYSKQVIIGIGKVTGPYSLTQLQRALSPEI